MKNSQKGFAIISLVIILTLLVIGGGAYVYVHNKQKGQSMIINSTAQTTPTTQTSNSQTVNWKTYRDDKFGFEFQYPPNYERLSAPLLRDEQFSTPFLRTGLDTGVRCGPPARGNCEMGVRSFFVQDDPKNKLSNSISTNIGTENIGGTEWFKYTYGSNGATVLRLFNDGVVVEFSRPTRFTDTKGEAPYDDTVFKEILSTFKFITLPYARIDKKLSGLKIGDKIGTLTINSVTKRRDFDSSISPISTYSVEIRFSGEVVLTGKYNLESFSSGKLVYFNELDSSTLEKMPKIDDSSTYKDMRLDFDNANDALSLIGHTARIEGRATILVDNLTQVFEAGGKFSTVARLLKIMDIER